MMGALLKVKKRDLTVVQGLISLKLSIERMQKALRIIQRDGL